LSRAKAVPVLALALFVGAAQAQDAGWGVVGGGFNYRWRTDGPHGHTEYCPAGACDDADWQRGNLDNAIGWRLGAEQSFHAVGTLRFLAGVELDLLFTEYNQSQRDITLGALLAVAGLDLDLGAVRPLLRAGVGAAGGDGHSGAAWFWEGGLDVRLAPGAAFRVATRRADYGGPETEELSLLLVATPGPRLPASGWSAAWSWGASMPGALVGDDLELSRAPLWRLAAQREVGGNGDRLGFRLCATSHESKLTSELGDVAGNQRGKWVIELGARWERVLAAGESRRWRLGAGIATASWWDDGNPFLVDGAGEVVEGDYELAGNAHGALDLRVGGSLWLTVELEQAYWPALELGEARLLVGLEVAL
jgi:opacity protein-like surface antigen